jgi:hypothetical protein
MVAKAYANRRDVWSRLSWDALEALSSPSMPAAARSSIERRILAGEQITADEIRAARGKRTRRQGDRPAARMAA